ncbi:MAG: hypothetical protein WBV11_16040 [Salegentibacter sp.]
MKTSKRKLLRLDDLRDPWDSKMDWLEFSPIGKEAEVFWVKNSSEFRSWTKLFLTSLSTFPFRSSREKSFVGKITDTSVKAIKDTVITVEPDI